MWLEAFQKTWKITGDFIVTKTDLEKLFLQVNCRVIDLLFFKEIKQIHSVDFKVWKYNIFIMFLYICRIFWELYSSLNPNNSKTNSCISLSQHDNIKREQNDCNPLFFFFKTILYCFLLIYMKWKIWYQVLVFWD